MTRSDEWALKSLESGRSALTEVTSSTIMLTSRSSAVPPEV
jgi:hypothetical protein